MSVPTKVHLRRKTRVLEVEFGEQVFVLPAEYLRVYSRSAEVTGHGTAPPKLEHGKQQVAIESVAPRGNYGVQLVFSDGHDSGIYSWEYLLALGTHQEQYWNDYLDRLHQAGLTRDPQASVVQFVPDR